MAATMASRLSQKSSLSAPSAVPRAVIQTWARLIRRGMMAITRPMAISHAAAFIHRMTPLLA